MRYTWRAACAVAAVVVTVEVLPAEMRGQEWKEQINQQILDSRIVRDWMSGGYTRSHELFYDLLAQGRSQTVNINLRAGQKYQFIGKCDNDCRDLDFRLFDENNNLVDSDTQTDDYPVVTATPRRTAQFHLRVIMSNCSARNCGWAVLALSRSASSTNANNNANNNGSGSRTASSGGTTAWKDQINKQILDSKIVRDFMNDGYSRSHDVFYDLQPQGNSQTINVELTSGRAYQFVGKCDNDCRDIDFRLYDDDGDLVDSDLEADDYPVVTVRARYTGKYRLRVSMANCSARTCGWGVIILSK